MRLRQQRLLRSVGQPHRHLSANQSRHQRWPKNSSHRDARDNLEDLRSGDLRKAIRRGDKFVDRIIEGAAEYIGIATANLINIFNPEVVVLGGGVIEALADEMMSVIVETAKDYAMPGTLKGVEIIASKLGDNAGITGAAVLARKETK